jgi:hypothetical protein
VILVTASDMIKVVATVSDPPVITPADVSRIEQESQQFQEAFAMRTACMEILTVDDLRIRIQSH